MKTGVTTEKIEDYTERYCIVGAGPAGLSMARSFKARGMAFDVFERHSDVGGIWDPENPGSPIYESAHFISSKTLSGYFDYPMPADYPDYPSHRQVLEYHRAFAREYNLYENIRFNTGIRNITKNDKDWLVTLADGERRKYKGVVCASGITWNPNIPDIPGDFNGEVIHSVRYNSAERFKGKRVLVVGAGNSGCDIACDAGANAKQAFISVRRGYYFIPKHIFGMPADVFGETSKWAPAWLNQFISGFLLKHVLVGDLRKVGLPAPDHKILETHPIANDQLIHHLRHGDVRAKGDIKRLNGDYVEFADGSREQIDLVVLATGYNWSIPYMDPEYFTWRGGRPDLYLSLFNREHENLFALGFMETDGGAYKLFDQMADMISAYAQEKMKGHKTAAKFERLIETDRPALNGGVHYLKTDRNAAYVNKHAYLKYLKRLRRKLGLPELKAGYFSSLKNDGNGRREPEQKPATDRMTATVGGGK